MEKIEMTTPKELSVIYCEHLNKEIYEKIGSFECKFFTEYIMAYRNYKGVGFDIDPPIVMHICGKSPNFKQYPILEHYCPENCMKTQNGYTMCVNYINKKYGINATKGEVHYE